MGFRINTNVAAMNAHSSASMTNRNLDSSLEKLSSGLRINKAADDASGMAIADSLRAQSNSIGQAVTNANDAIGIVQIADKAMDEQLKILDTIRTKAVQSAQDGQSAASRASLQKDVTRLLEELNNIANTTSYNGQSLLSGNFSNKSFQIGAYSNTTINASIGSTNAEKIGHTRYETSDTMTTAAGAVVTEFSVAGKSFVLESVDIDISAGSGVGTLANVINKNSDLTGVRASFVVQTTGSASILSADVTGLAINGTTIGTISGITQGDGDGRLVSAINAVKDQTGVEAFVDNQGRLNLKSADGRGISLAGANLSDVGFSAGSTGSDNLGKLTLTKLDSRDIVLTMSATTNGALGNMSAGAAGNEATLNLTDAGGQITSTQAAAIGALANSNVGNTISNGIGAGLTSLKGAMAVMDIAESAQKTLDSIRADLGSVQNQLISTVNNISVTQVNVKAAESNIRDVDFAAESSNFSKNQILAQSGSYALSQANAVQQNVMRLLQ